MAQDNHRNDMLDLRLVIKSDNPQLTFVRPLLRKAELGLWVSSPYSTSTFEKTLESGETGKFFAILNMAKIEKSFGEWR